MTRTHLARRLSGAAIVGIVAVTLAGAFSGSASADSLPAAGCVTACTATFDTAGATDTLLIPTGITSLTATIAGAAGAPASFAITNDPTAVGGPGGGLSGAHEGGRHRPGAVCASRTLRR